jgi:phage baseplate assembly protein W
MVKRLKFEPQSPQLKESGTSSQALLFEARCKLAKVTLYLNP